MRDQMQMQVGDCRLPVIAQSPKDCTPGGPVQQVGEGEGRFTLSCGLLPLTQQAGFPQNSREGPRTGMGTTSG